VSKLRACPEPHVVLRHDQGVSDAHAPVAVHVPTAARACELLDAIVAGVGDEDVPAPIDGDTTGAVELPVPAARATPLPNEGPGVRELLDAVVGEVGDVDVPARIHSHVNGGSELPVPEAEAAPRGEEGPGVRELLDAVVAGVGDEDVPAPIHRDAIGAGVELPVPAAEAAPFGDEGAGKRRVAHGGNASAGAAEKTDSGATLAAGARPATRGVNRILAGRECRRGRRGGSRCAGLALGSGGTAAKSSRNAGSQAPRNGTARMAPLLRAVCGPITN